VVSALLFVSIFPPFSRSEKSGMSKKEKEEKSLFYNSISAFFLGQGGREPAQQRHLR